MEIHKIGSTLSTEMTSGKSRASAPPQEISHLPPQQVISQDWQLLEQSQQDLGQLADVDSAKVDALRQALKDGSFDLDLSAIADKMISQHG
ncbi:flagellar biosynthesis anti-sigma factor FlgM [Shewanella sp. AS16]|uniref:flagellar biosynthesis anti-sigma factor FlgM n=1 Tax=Shewanella sp. AS16 TaxID=2907625 RepID=UPI001F324C82|nr:flagellar biosynthesis anti-sigma factor FlgM [Shewanella sp. AS16]MCE9686236.1 flagellar biosynthesis anti-sigma factor FlgM [Shewanella sp. AS16]